MAEPIIQQQYSSDVSSKVLDIEEKQRLLKDRILLIGQSLIEEREKNFREIQEVKKSLLQTKEENTRIKELLERVTEQINNLARREEVFALQRQLDLIRK